MSATVILLNPMGSDVTNYCNGTPWVPQLLKGTVMAPGDTLYTLPYTNLPGAGNIDHGVDLLDAKLHATAGPKRVFGYSEGCQVADKWLATYGASTPIDPTQLSFVLIGNADRRYGGFVYGHSIFNGVGYTGGKPAGTAYPCTDFVRQYDSIGDFPNAQPIVDALTALATAGSDQNALTGAMHAIAKAVSNTAYATAAYNALVGAALIHNWYIDVAVADAHNVRLVEGQITWVWSPTYPVPMLGVTGLPVSDQQMRLQIESAYSRPVVIPMPDYAGRGVVSPQGTVTPTAPVAGWFPEIPPP